MTDAVEMLPEWADWSTAAATGLEPHEARELVTEVQNWLDDYPLSTVTELYAGRAWEALGYRDWDELCREEFGDRVRLARPERAELVGHMREAGMPHRAIAAALGVSDGTVRNDAGAQGCAPDPEHVTGRDGKRYPPRRPVAEDTHRPTPTPEAPPPLPYSPPPALLATLDTGRPVVVNMRDTDLRDWLSNHGYLLRIDRATKWGNPFLLDDDGDRAQVIAAYRDHYLPHKPSLTGALPDLAGKALGCWCAPDPCHGDALIEAWRRHAAR